MLYLLQQAPVRSVCNGVAQDAQLIYLQFDDVAGLEPLGREGIAMQALAGAIQLQEATGAHRSTADEVRWMKVHAIGAAL